MKPSEQKNILAQKIFIKTLGESNVNIRIENKKKHKI
jgi:hypothetical protein